MFDLPTILPADPRAPEGLTVDVMPLQYGPVARLILRLERRVNVARSRQNSRRTLPEMAVGFTAASRRGATTLAS